MCGKTIKWKCDRCKGCACLPMSRELLDCMYKDKIITVKEVKDLLLFRAVLIYCPPRRMFIINEW